jgi:molybdate transport system substrate-binding protein
MRSTVAFLVLLPLVARAEERRELTVFAAASLREPFAELARALEQRTPGLKVRLNFAGSQELRAQIEHGARADVFASADLAHMAALEKAGLAVAPRTFAHNQLVVVVPRENPARLGAFVDLPRAKRLVIGAPVVPIGAYTLRILDRTDADFRRRVLARVVSKELNVRQVLAKVALGEADAGIVYRTDARAAGGEVLPLDIPAALNVVAEYPIAVLGGAAEPAAARAFVELVLSPEGQERLAAAGFTSPTS